MSRWKSYNANPDHNNVGDCTVRAISKALGQDWERTYIEMCLQGFLMHDMPSANHVWGQYLKDKGYRRYIIPDDLPADYSVQDFCEDNPDGIFILALDGHVVAVENGNYFDTFDSGQRTPLYYWQKEV